MTGIVVEAAFGFAPTATSATWTDITQWVNLKAGIRITRGAQDELSQIQQGTCAFSLDNQDGRFTGGNAASPYSPYIRPSCPVRVTRVTADKNLMPNCSFEDGVTDWLSSGTPTRVASATHVQDGTQAMLVTFGVAAGQHVRSPPLQGLDIGETYTFSAYVWVPAGDTPVQLTVAGGPAGAQSTVTGGFQRISVTWTATDTTHYVRVAAVGVPAAGDQVWVDACQVEEGSTPTAFDSNSAEVHRRFYGMVGDWDAKWSGLQGVADVVATDLLKHLGHLPQLGPLLVEEVLRLEPRAYYPLTEPSTSTTAGDLAGEGAGSLNILQIGVGGTLTFGEAEGPPATEQNAVKLTPVSASVGKYLTADLGQQVEDATSTYYNWVEGWFQTSTANRVMCGFASTSGNTQLVFLLNASGFFTIEHTTSGLPRTVTVVGATNLADGGWHHFIYDEFTQDVYIDDGPALTPTITPVAMLRTFTVGGWSSDRIWNGQLGHFALHAQPAGVITAHLMGMHYYAGATGFAGDDADNRMLRLALYAGIGSIAASGTFGQVGSQGAGGSGALEMMRTVEATEGGKLAADRGAASLIFQSRTVRYNTPASVTLDYADLETGDVSMPIDDQKLINTVVASRPGGATQRAISRSSRTAYGPYEAPGGSLSLIKMDDAQVLAAASWLVYRYAEPQPELRQIPVEAFSLPLATYRALLDADISTVADVTNLPSQAAASTVTATVEGYNETIGLSTHRLDFHASRTSTDSVWVLNDATYSVLGTTTRLAY